MMESKFDINYLIGQNEKKSIASARNIKEYETDISHDGWILITIGGYDFGALPRDSSLEGYEQLDTWFQYLREVYFQLKSTTTVFFNYWESPYYFFIFEKTEENIKIRLYERNLPVINGKIQEPMVHEVKILAEIFVPKDIFFEKIKSSVNSFWSEIEHLNPILTAYVKQFKI